MNQEVTGTKKRGRPRKTQVLSESQTAYGNKKDQIENPEPKTDGNGLVRKAPESLIYYKLTLKNQSTLCPKCTGPSYTMSSPIEESMPGKPHRVQRRKCKNCDHRWVTWFYVDNTGEPI